MPRKTTFKYKPSDLLQRLSLSSFAFLGAEARQKIDELMELVSFDRPAYERQHNANVRWFVLPDDEKIAATHRMTVCRAVYWLMEEASGLSQQQAINDLLTRGEMSRRASGLRTDRHQALRALSLRPGFLGLRTVQVWIEKIEGVPEGYDQLVALVPAHVLESKNSFLDALAQDTLAQQREQNHA